MQISLPVESILRLVEIIAKGGKVKSSIGEDNNEMYRFSFKSSN